MSDRPARFCVAWLVSTAILFALIATFNVAVDPYDIMGVPRIAGFNKFKVDAPFHTVLAKLYQIRRARPTTVLFGSSVVNVGLDPQSPLWPATMRPVYNFGVPAMGVKGNYEALKYAAVGSGVRNAVVVLQFETFLASFSEAEGQGNDLPDDPSSVPRLDDFLLSMFTLSALEDSVSTVIHQRDASPIDLASDGAIGESGFRRAVQRVGQGEVFARSEDIVATELGKFTALHAPLNESIPKLTYVRDIMDFCDAHGIALVFVLPPAHMTELQMIDRAGIWNVYELWLRSLATVVAAHRGGSISLWDLGGYSPYTTEPAPAKGSNTTQTEWFWDILHFKRKLGDLILSRLLTGQPSGFGLLLTPENVDNQLAGERTAVDCGPPTSAPLTGPGDTPSDACRRKRNNAKPVCVAC
jgi:hypothetical protein